MAVYNIIHQTPANENRILDPEETFERNVEEYSRTRGSASYETKENGILFSDNRSKRCLI